MLPFLRHLLQEPRKTRTVIVLDDDGIGNPETYRIIPGKLVLLTAGIAIGVTVLSLLLILFTPLRKPILGTDTESLRAIANESAARIAALSDSLESQQTYVETLRETLVGITPTETEDVQDAGASQSEIPEIAPLSTSEEYAEPQRSFELVGLTDRSAADSLLRTLPFPALPPVSGFLARGLDASRGHWGLDLVVPSGTTVRSVGDGYVIFADWTNSAGYTIVIQHAAGFLTVYKHNSELLANVGDHVSDREAIALSGNTGERSSGPHLHFELWRDGFAQDPLHYLLNIQAQ